MELGNESDGVRRLSPEDSAIAADIDSSALLLNDLKQMESPPPIPLPPPSNSNRRSRSTRSQPTPLPSSTNRGLEGEQDANQNWEDLYNLPELSILPPLDPPTSEELPSLSILGVPTVPETSNGTPPLPGNSLGLSSGGLNNYQGPDLTRLPVSPLQSAMDRLYSPNIGTNGDRNPDNADEASQGRESTPERESNRGSSAENRPNPAQNPANSGSQTSPNPSGNTPQPAQTPNNIPQNGPNPYANPIPPGPNNPYGTPLTSPSPYGNSPQPAQMPNSTPGNLPSSGGVQESLSNPSSGDPNRAITPRLPGEISPTSTLDYSTDDNLNPYQPLPVIPAVPNSNPTNAHEYLWRSAGEQVPVAPTAPTAVPQAPSNLGTATDLTPNSSIYQGPTNNPVGNSPTVSPGVQPLNQPNNLPSPSPLNQPTNVPTYQPLNPPSIQSPQMDNSGLNLNRNTPGVQPIQPIQPFSVPNPTPGRHIGGGNINTFSNP